jgi:hypothetical protein
MRTRRAPSCAPSTSLRDARGITRTANVRAPSLCEYRITFVCNASCQLAQALKIEKVNPNCPGTAIRRIGPANRATEWTLRRLATPKG